LSKTFFTGDKKGAKDDSDERSDCDREHGGIPAAAIGDSVDNNLGAYGITEKVTEQADETGCSSGGILRNEIEGLNAGKGNRAINEEAYHAKSHIHEHFLGSGLSLDYTCANHPVQEDSKAAKEHTDDIHRGAASLEDFRGCPAAGDSTDSTDNIMDGEGYLTLGSGHDSLGLEICRGPVTNSIAYHIDCDI
jgi:hypothetical protein